MSERKLRNPRRNSKAGTETRPDRLFLIVLGAGLALMLISVVSFRLHRPSLLVHTHQSAPMPNPMTAEGLPAEMPPAMAEALARRQAEQTASGMGQTPPADMTGTPLEQMLPANMAGSGMADIMRRLQQNPHDADALLELGHNLMDDRPELALDFLQQAAVAAPSDSRPPHALGVLLHRQGKHAEAAVSLERSLELEDSAPTRYSLGVLLRHHLDRPEDALRHLEAALQAPGLTPELRTLIEQELNP